MATIVVPPYAVAPPRGRFVSLPIREAQHAALLTYAQSADVSLECVLAEALQDYIDAIIPARTYVESEDVDG